MKLTEKQKRWIDYYIETGNATEAARMAGYHGKNLNRIGAENLSKLDCCVAERLSAKEDDRIARQDEVLRHLTAAMRGEVTEEVVLVVEGEVRHVPKGAPLRDRNKAAELLAKRYGLLTENVKLSGEVGVQIVDDIPAEG